MMKKINFEKISVKSIKYEILKAYNKNERRKK